MESPWNRGMTSGASESSAAFLGGCQVEADAEMGDGGCTWARAITASWRAVFWRNDMRIQRLYIDLTYI